MSESIGRVDLNQMLQMSAQELTACQDGIVKSSQAAFAGQIQATQSTENQALAHLMDTLENTSAQLAKAIDTERVVRIDPSTMKEIEAAIEVAISVPSNIDVKISDVYVSIFGWNTPLWQVLRDMQKLLRTVEILKDTRGKRVAKVVRGQKVNRKRREE